MFETDEGLRDTSNIKRKLNTGICLIKTNLRSALSMYNTCDVSVLCDAKETAFAYRLTLISQALPNGQTYDHPSNHAS